MAEFHEVQVDAEFHGEFAESLRITEVEFEGEQMVSFEVLREGGQIIAYPITPNEARRVAGLLMERADATERRSASRK